MPSHSEVSGEREAGLAQLETWVRELLEANAKRAHGWLHTDRVRANIRILARAEMVDPFLAEVAALLHDVGRTQPGPETEHGARSAAIAGLHLKALALTSEEVEAVLHAIRWHNSLRDDTPLLRILRDADMLDGLGAIGIVRAFMSKSDLPPYDSVHPFQEGTNRWPPSYCSDQLQGQMEWYDRLNTETARLMAKKRIDFMSAFITQARDEIMLSADGQISNA
jgi:HD superfamily phosphodiesterase